MPMGTRNARTLGYGEAALVVCAAIGSGAFAVPELAGWPPTPAAIAFCAPHPDQRPAGRTLRPALSRPASAPDDWTTVRPTFVVDLTALLLLGTGAGVIVSAACAIVRLLGEAPGRSRPAETLLSATAPLLALEAAAFTHLALGGTIGTLRSGRGRRVPIAAAVLRLLPGAQRRLRDRVAAALGTAARQSLARRRARGLSELSHGRGAGGGGGRADRAAAVDRRAGRQRPRVLRLPCVRRSLARAASRSTGARTRWRRSTTACRWSTTRAS